MKIQRLGKDSITIPEKMTVSKIVDWLETWDRAENALRSVSRKIDGFTEDLIHAANLAIEETGDFVSFHARESFFGSQPPNFIDIQINPQGDKKTCFYGTFSLPEFEGGTIQILPGGSDMILAANVKARFVDTIKKWMDRVEQIAREQSIYRGQSIRMDWNGDDCKLTPTFLSLPNIPMPIFDFQVARQIDVYLQIIRHANKAMAQGIPLRRGVVLAGPYGTGKSMLATYTAAVAVRHGWTFAYCPDPLGLTAAYETMQRFQPSVLFVEDIDRLCQNSNSFHDLQIVLDGITSKDNQVILIMTTNHPDNLPPVMRRPGRIDSYIEIGYPSAETACKIVEFYAGELFADEIDYMQLGPMIENQPPAALREVVERAKIFGLSNLEEEPMLTNANILDAAVSLQPHFKYSKETLALTPVAV